jgi:hypothetical protein
LSETPLTNADFPPLYRAADHSSLDAQRWFLSATKIRLAGLMGAALFGLMVWRADASPVDWSGVLAALCFVIALVVEAYLLKSKPERTWYEGRAAAESVKTLSWRYIMGAEPFGIQRAAAEVDTLFLRQLDDVLGVLKGLDLTPDGAVDQQISARMRELRAAPLAARKAAYDAERIGEQEQWYSRKAKENRDLAKRWQIAMLVFECVGVAGGILKAVGTIEGDVLGFAGAVVAAMTAWLQTKQHRTLATAYAVTALELASVRSRIQYQQSEADWAAFVSDAEGAISREHTLWKASRSVRSI